MPQAFYEKGREGFADGTLDWDTNAFKIMAMDLNTTDVGVKAITGATNATPIVITSTAHGYTSGDVVSQTGVLGNLSANGLFKIANVTANTYELQTLNPITGALTNVTGSGAYTSGGFAVNLGPSASGDNLDDFDGCRVGTDQSLANRIATNGYIDADDPTWTALTGATIEAFMIYKDTGVASTSRVAVYLDGFHVVTANTQAAASATSILVEPLQAGIANGETIAFSNGQLATLTAVAAAGDRAITVSALSGIVTAGAKAAAKISITVLPFTPNGSNLTLNFDNGLNKIGRV